MATLRSPYPDVDIPDVSLTEYVIGGAAARGDKPALIDGATGAVTTYADLADQVARVASGLAAEGIAPGDAVGLLGPNTAGWAVAFDEATGTIEECEIRGNAAANIGKGFGEVAHSGFGR